MSLEKLFEEEKATTTDCEKKLKKLENHMNSLSTKW